MVTVALRGNETEGVFTFLTLEETEASEGVGRS